MKFEITGTVRLSVRAVAELDEPPHIDHAANILKGGYHGTKTLEMDVEDVEITELVENG